MPANPFFFCVCMRPEARHTVSNENKNGVKKSRQDHQQRRKKGQTKRLRTSVHSVSCVHVVPADCLIVLCYFVCCLLRYTRVACGEVEGWGRSLFTANVKTRKDTPPHTTSPSKTRRECPQKEKKSKITSRKCAYPPIRGDRNKTPSCFLPWQYSPLSL
jgi:hypothetical protein